MNRSILACAVSLAMPLFTAATAGSLDTRVFTLYRSSVAIIHARIHVATFDSGQKAMNGTVAQYNLENCQIAASLLREQPGVKVLYWCEPGRAADALGSQ